METIGYVLGDIVELHTTATRKKKSVLQKIVFAGVALLLLLFISYELFLLVESYKHPTWIPNVKHMETIQYPEIIFCPPEGSTIEKSSVKCNSYSNGKKDGPCSRTIFEIPKGQFKTQACLNINFETTDYTPVEASTNETNFLLVKYKTIKAAVTPNALLRSVDVKDDDLDLNRSAKSNSTVDEEPEPLEPFGNPTYVMVFDQNKRHDPDFSFQPNFILSNGHFYVSITRQEDHYRNGQVTYDFDTSVSSSVPVSKDDVGFTSVAFTITNFDVIVSEETVAYNWLDFLGNVGGAIAFVNVLYLIFSAIGHKVVSLIRRKRKSPPQELEQTINLLDDFDSLEEHHRS